MKSDTATWLPNLVGSVSIWKLAVDLNDPKFMGGRLLVPETEGSESLPVSVRWDLTGLVPLAEARASDPVGTSAAIGEFQACLERTAKAFATPNSGYDKYKQAFTVPSLEADEGGSYFYSPADKKLFVANWGASPRTMGAASSFVFGWEDWGKMFAGGAAAAAAGGAAMAGAASAVAGAATGGPGAAAAEGAKAGEEKKPDEKKPDEKKRAWWVWPLFALVAIAAVLLALLLLKGCEDEKVNTANDAGKDGAAALEAGADAATADASAAADGGADAGGAGADAGAGAIADAGADAAAAADAGRDGGAKDGGLALEDDDDDEEPGTGTVGGGGGGGPVVVQIGPAGGTAGPKTGPHRRHYQAEAVAWRVGTGKDRVARTEQRGRRFDVWLGAGRTFDGVRVEWQDKAGKWHVH